jgi:hypothetical protein
MEKKFDAVRIPTISLTRAEIDQAYDEMAMGNLPADYIDRHFEELEKNIWGADAKKDRHGHYIEQGLGSAFSQTRNSIEAYQARCSSEPDFEKHLARMESELVASDARRKAEAEKKGPSTRRYTA